MRTANVPVEGAALKSYLSSGKSSAMAMSLRPISFHCFSRATDGLAARFGDAAFFAESRVCAGSTKAPATQKRSRKSMNRNYRIAIVAVGLVLTLGGTPSWGQVPSTNDTSDNRGNTGG